MLSALCAGCAKGSDAAGDAASDGGAGGSNVDAGGSGGTGNADSGGSSGAGNADTGGSGGAPTTASNCVNSEAVLEEHAIVEASPVVSTNKPVVVSDGVEGAEHLVDGALNPSQHANFGMLEEGPAWAAIDVGEGPSRLLLLFSDNGQGAYDLLSGAPLGYSIETSANSSDGLDGDWETALEVTDNDVRIRAHSFDFSGMRWVRFTATEPVAEGRSVRISELLLHDVSSASGDRPEDSWLFFGDSIHQAAMTRTLGEQSFEHLVSAEHSRFEPIMLNASIGGEHLSDAIARLDHLLQVNPDIQHIAVAYGTNDAWGNHNPESIGFRNELTQVVETVLDAGRTPILARIPHASPATHSTLPAFNAIIDEVQAEYGLPCGPDFYTWFLENPEDMGGDGVHPNASGNQAINALWAEAASPLYAVE